MARQTIRVLLLLFWGSALFLTIRLVVAEAEFRLDPQAALRSPNWIEAAHLARFEASSDELRAAVSLNPRLSSAWIQLGLEAEADGNLPEAETDLLRAASVDRLYVPAWTLVNFYFRRGNEPEFWAWAKRAAELTSDDYRPLLRLADSLETSPQHVATSVATRLGGGAPLLRAYLDILINAHRLDSAQEIAGLLARRHDPVDRERLAAFAERLKVRLPLLVSLVLHVVAIALLLTIRPPEPPLARMARVTAIASPYRAPAPVKSHPRLKFDQRVQPLRPLGAVAPTFRVPDRLPQAALPRLTLAIPDPPNLQSPDVRAPESAPLFIELPPPPVRRVVTPTGAFDPIPSNQAIPIPHTEISTGTFGEASAASSANRSGRNTDAAISSAAEVLSKPRPAYTDEARRLQIQGEVLLEVLFAASGEARVLRTIRGLGHGLDENAISAARAIQFRPAKRGDTAVDSTAVVHIIFQLAY